MLQLLKNVPILRYFAGTVNMDSYIFVREPYDKTLKELVYSITEANIYHLIKSLLSIF